MPAHHDPSRRASRSHLGRRPVGRRIVGASLAATLLLAACGDDDGTTPASGEPTETTAPTTTSGGEPMAASTDDRAARLRATLTAQLQEHVYLAGIAIEQAVSAGGDLEDPTVAAAVAALDANSVDLADTVGSVTDTADRDAFLDLWRAHIGFFVDYTLGQATGDDDAVQQAIDDLDGYKQAAGAFFEEITAGELPADALVANLDMHISTVFATIDALVAGDAGAFDQLRRAAHHMSSSALALSTAIIAATS